jgi:hypothetical protein
MAMPKASARRVVRPHPGWFALLDGGLVALGALAASEQAHRTMNKVAPAPLPSRKVLQGILAGALAIHVGEALAAARLARRKGQPVLGWALQTLVVGFPSLLALKAV